MTTTSLGDRVVAQAHLLADLLHALAPDVEDPSELPAPSAGIAERLFRGLQDLHDALAARDDAPAVRDDAPATAQERRQPYQELVERIRTEVSSVLPHGSIVAVVSRGDPALVRLPGLEGWHYPQNVLGVWAGYHPATGRDAVDHLLELQRRGARYLLIPATSRWWLDHYTELRTHLTTDARPIVADGDLSLFELDGTAAGPPQDPARAKYDRQVRAFVELTDALVPAGAAVVVVTRGDDAWLRCARAEARHFPADRSGVYAGHPATDSDAIASLGLAIELGARYLSIPAPMRWWERSYPQFAEHIDEHHRPVADRSEVGVFFELTPLTAG